MPYNSNVIFGGPDKPKNILRDRLLAEINAVPAKGNIFWVCYYFHDPDLFTALIAAAQRDVKIEIIIDGKPRCPDINQACISLLKNQANIKLILATTKPLWEYFGLNWHAHTHSKIYYFSHPEPHALIGSYNPTSDAIDSNTDMIEKIGDHSISYNTLVKINDAKLLTNILAYFKQLRSDKARYLARYSKLNNQKINCSTWSMGFLPRISKHPISSLFSSNDDNAIIKCAISHFKGPGMLQTLLRACKAGKKVELILDSTQRRVPKILLTQLEQHNIIYRQLTTSKHCLMHNKFIIYKSDNDHCVFFGSFNWSLRSWWLNHEVIVVSRDKQVITSFETRWQQMLALD